MLSRINSGSQKVNAKVFKATDRKRNFLCQFIFITLHHQLLAYLGVPLKQLHY